MNTNIHFLTEFENAVVQSLAKLTANATTSSDEIKLYKELYANTRFMGESVSSKGAITQAIYRINSKFRFHGWRPLIDIDYRTTYNNCEHRVFTLDVELYRQVANQSCDGGVTIDLPEQPKRVVRFSGASVSVSRSDGTLLGTIETIDGEVIFLRPLVESVSAESFAREPTTIYTDELVEIQSMMNDIQALYRNRDID